MNLHFLKDVGGWGRSVTLAFALTGHGKSIFNVFRLFTCGSEELEARSDVRRWLCCELFRNFFFSSGTFNGFIVATLDCQCQKPVDGAPKARRELTENLLNK